MEIIGLRIIQRICLYEQVHPVIPLWKILNIVMTGFWILPCTTKDSDELNMNTWNNFSQDSRY